MHAELHETEAFYATRQGLLARRLIGRQIRQLWPELRRAHVLTLGYGLPYMPLLEPAALAVAVLGGETNVGATQGRGRTLRAREDDLPFPDRSFDRVLLIHALELSANPQRLLREVWRVLTDDGRLIAVVPNRRGLWCLSERTPFGHGQPYSSGQLARRLEGHLFRRGAERGSLYLPPTRSRLLLRLALPVERLGLTLAPKLAGVMLVEAEKRIYAGTPILAEQPARGRRYAVVPRALAPAERLDDGVLDDLAWAA
jgi:SAM-dependent methyltransferase